MKIGAWGFELQLAQQWVRGAAEFIELQTGGNAKEVTKEEITKKGKSSRNDTIGSRKDDHISSRLETIPSTVARKAMMEKKLMTATSNPAHKNEFSRSTRANARIPIIEPGIR